MVSWPGQDEVFGSKGLSSRPLFSVLCDRGLVTSARSPHRSMFFKAPSGLTPSGLRAWRNGGGPSGPGALAGEGSAHLSGIENANDARDNRAVLTFVFLADELDVSQFAEVEVAFLLQPVHCQLQIQQLRGEKAMFKPEIPDSDFSFPP